MVAGMKQEDLTWRVGANGHVDALVVVAVVV